MGLHENSQSKLASRPILVERVTQLGGTVREAAEANGLSERSAYR